MNKVKDYQELRHKLNLSKTVKEAEAYYEAAKKLLKPAQSKDNNFK